MKRLFYCAGITITLTFFNSCAQHDPKSPDTSGGDPYGTPGVGVDTSNAGRTNNAGNDGTNHSNDATNNNQMVNTGDSNTKKQ